MALLLATWQKMRLIREKNQLVLEQSQFSSKLTRIEKNIERTQKRYTSLFAKLESQAKMMQSQAQVMFNNMANLGTNSVALNNYSGMNGFVYGLMQKALGDGTLEKYKFENGKRIADGTVAINFDAMFNEWQKSGDFRLKRDKNGNVIYKADNKTPEYEGGWSQEQVDAFNTCMQQAKMQQQNAQMWVQNQNQQYQNNVSIWLEAQKAQLEVEQDAALEPLNYQQTMLELEKNQKDARLKRIEAELQSYTELANKEAENTAPTFGLR
jgi:hypothetical protein